MAVNEEAAQLSLLAQQLPFHAAQEITTVVEQTGAQITNLLGHDHDGNERLQTLVNEVMQLGGNTFQALELLRQACLEVAQNVQRG